MNFGLRIDEILEDFYDGDIRQSDMGKAKQAITSLTKELVVEAKPAEKEQQLTSKIDNETMCRYYRYGGYNFAIDKFEENLLKALEEV